MELSWASRKLQKALASEKAMLKEFGDRAKNLKLRLRVLEQAQNLSKVRREPPERCHELTNDRAGQFAVTIKDNWRIIFVPDHDPVPKKLDGGIDLEAVTAITILEIADYH